MKLAVNLPLTVFWQALADVCAVMHEVPMKPDRLIDLFADTGIGAALLKARAEQVVAVLEGRSIGPASFDIDFMRKDLREVLQDAQTLGHVLPVAAQTLRCFDETSPAGSGAIDGTEYPAWWLSHMYETARA